jgi:Flagellar hook-length control protein FliK
MTTTGLPPGIGVIDNATPRSAPGAQVANTTEFADLLAPTSKLASLASLTLLPTIETADATVELSDETAVEEYSPEGWIELLALALGSESRLAQQPAARSASQSVVDGLASGSLVTTDRALDADTDDAIATALLPRSDFSVAGLRGAESVAGASAKVAATQEFNAWLTPSATPTIVSELLSAVVEPSRDWLDALSAAGSSAVGTRSNAPYTSVALMQPIGTAAWQEEIATRVAWLVRGAEQTAMLALNPADLGPVEVRVAVREGEASVVFSALHADTRVALEAALPRLREMFALQGLLLTDGSVLAGNAGGSSDAASEQTKRAQADLRRAMRQEDAADVAAVTSVGPRSLLDLYA